MNVLEHEIFFCFWEKQTYFKFFRNVLNIYDPHKGFLSFL